MIQTPKGLVVVHAPNVRYGRAHERSTRAEIARRLAALKGYDFAGPYDSARSYAGGLYVVPSDTLVGPEAQALGIRDEHDLFGGVVPYRFAATKAITHPLVEADAPAPAGWPHGLAERLQGVVLSGFSAFSLDDARRAGARLFDRGPARIKPVRETGGLGQTVAADPAALERALAALDPAEVARDGVVLEQNLTAVTTYSVGQVRVADLVATYYGTQRLTRDHSGASVYGGSDLVVVRGGFEALLALDLTEGARLAVAQARAYDAAAAEVFPGIILSRRNYDIAQGFDPQGRSCSGVLEQSWRIGGASGAEIAALEAFRADPALRVVRASTVEIYGDREPPPQATLYFRGVDEEVGPMTKYAVTARYDDA
jgi:Protein of unknown function (DUF3182)